MASAGGDGGGMMSPAGTVLIVGGGIAGLTAALALRRAGVAVEIFEQAAAAGDVGAGISLGRAASRGLYALGLREALLARGDTLQGSAARHYVTGEILGGAFAARNYSAADFAESHMIHRADLFDILQQALAQPVQFGRKFAGFSQDEHGVTARFADGATMRGACLLGCDGLRSTVRAAVFGETPARRTGFMAYRFLVPMADAAPHIAQIGVANVLVGPQRSLLYYPIRKATLLNCVALVEGDDLAEGWSQRVEVAELQKLFAGWHPAAAGLAAAAPPERTAKWALFDRDPLPSWTEGRVALLGDAAHPMLPFLGMGAAAGIADAVILGRVFQEETDVSAALRRYEAARLHQANDILLASRHQAEIFASGPDHAGERKLAARVDYDPATVAI